MDLLHAASLLLSLRMYSLVERFCPAILWGLHPLDHPAVLNVTVCNAAAEKLVVDAGEAERQRLVAEAAAGQLAGEEDARKLQEQEQPAAQQEAASGVEQAQPVEQPSVQEEEEVPHVSVLVQWYAGL